MNTYRVEVGYKTKREAVSLGMTIKAYSEDEAEDKALEKALKGYPARKWMFTRIMLEE